jgi:dihydroorotate dehydrogenase electron transfer subunit
LSGYHIAANKMRTTTIANIKSEGMSAKVFSFEDRIASTAKPGQFIMLWVPGIDEIPLSVMDATSDRNVSVVVKNVGEATASLHAKSVGDVIGIRGPFGNSFSLAEGDILMVGGGTGIAPLFLLTKTLNRAKSRIRVVIGAKTKAELILKKQFEAILSVEDLIATTEDGTCGTAGLCTEPLEKLLLGQRFDFVYSCGPERMLQTVFKLAEKHGIIMEASLERLMRCAIGVCGSCIIGKYRVCTDGPVFKSDQLREVNKEFGKTRRAFDGRKTKP